MKVPRDAATAAWVIHTLGECDPDTCPGVHDDIWCRWRRRAIEEGRAHPKG